MLQLDVRSLDPSLAVCYCQGPRRPASTACRNSVAGQRAGRHPTGHQQVEPRRGFETIRQAIEGSKGADPGKKRQGLSTGGSKLKAEPVAAASRCQAAPPAPPRRPAFYEALAIYETGFERCSGTTSRQPPIASAAVIQRYPGERELVERARLYLQVCERETARRPSGPQTPTESVYAATVALNAGDVEGALAHLGRALEKAPDSDHAHYIMSVALVDKGDLVAGAGPPAAGDRPEPRK